MFRRSSFEGSRCLRRFVRFAGGLSILALNRRKQFWNGFQQCCEIKIFSWNKSGVYSSQPYLFSSGNCPLPEGKEKEKPSGVPENLDDHPAASITGNSRSWPAILPAPFCAGLI